MCVAAAVGNENMRRLVYNQQTSDVHSAQYRSILL